MRAGPFDDGPRVAAESPPGLDLDALGTYFATHVPGSGGEGLTAELIEGGRSNLTYYLHDDGGDWVLRRPPLGHVLPTAHDMSREFRVLAALASTDVPVPGAVSLCESTDVIGAPFYVMERVKGRVIREQRDAVTLDEDSARAASAALVDVLARIHAVDYAAVGLADWGRPDGYLERQVRRWGKQWQASRTRPLPGLEDVMGWLADHLPDSQDASIVHGDYRLDNVMLHTDDAGTIVAVFDWEMSTLGDPLADLGLLLVYWDEPGDAARAAVPVAQGVTGGPGWYRRREVAEAYARFTGRDLSKLPFYMVLAYFKLAIVLEGIHTRHSMGLTVGPGFDRIGEAVPPLIEAALETAAGRSL